MDNHRIAVNTADTQDRSDNLDKSTNGGALSELHELNQELNPFAHNEQKPKRTLGLKIFDSVLYSGIVNPIIFIVSIGATYLTYNGRSFGHDGTFARKVGEWFAGRREPILKGFNAIGVKNEEAAKYGTTVFFSFLDGTLFAPLVKLLEDRREKIAHKIDDSLGTAPQNLKVYEAEPKQSWRSVVEGRVATSAIVLPVAITMQITKGNKKIFYDRGDKLADFVKNKVPKLDQWLSKATIHNKQEFFQTVVFEAFYTSVCTFGLYLLSRGIARKHPPKSKLENAATPTYAGFNAQTSILEALASPEAKDPNPDTPRTTVMQPSHMERVQASPRALEVTA